MPKVKNILKWLIFHIFFDILVCVIFAVVRSGNFEKRTKERKKEEKKEYI